MSGDDDIEVDVNALALASFSVFGDPNPGSAGGQDNLTVRGVDGGPDNDNLIWEPTGVGGGNLQVGAQVLGVNPLVVSGVEALVYDGESQNETPEVRGAGRFVHTPGADRDAGTVQLDNWLAISYLNLGLNGTVTVAGTGGGDTLVALGTDSSDVVDVSFPGTDDIDVGLTSSLGQHVSVLSTDVENYEVNSLEGDDHIRVQAPLSVSGAFTVFGGGPSGSDVVTVLDEVGAANAFTLNQAAVPGEGTVTVDAGALAYVGIEHVQLLASGDLGDALTVIDDGGDNTWTAAAGPMIAVGGIPMPSDRIQIGSRETIDYITFDTVELRNAILSDDTFNIHPTHLFNFFFSFTVDGDGDDVLNLIGRDLPDTFLQSSATQFTVNSVPIDFSPVSIGTIGLLGAGGDDAFTVDLSLLDAGVRTVIVEAGQPTASDVLNLTVPTDGVITQGADATSGVAVEVGQSPNQAVHYTGLELLNVQSATAGSDLTVRGTDDDDTLTIQPFAGGASSGRVWLNDGTVIAFNAAAADFDALTLAGRFGDDRFNITPLSGVAITARGAVNTTVGDTGNDVAVVNGTSGADTITYTPDSTAAGQTDQATVQVNALGLVTLESLAQASIHGVANDDQLTVVGTGGDDRVVHVPGAAADAGEVRVNSLLPLAYEQLGLGGSLTINGGSGGAADELEYVGRASSDVFGVAGVATITLNNHIDVDTAAVEAYRLQGWAGMIRSTSRPRPGLPSGSRATSRAAATC